MKKTIMVFAAHPDDEVLGCAGTLYNLARQGNDIYIAIIAEGITSRYNESENIDTNLIQSLHSCGEKAASLLGVKKILFYDMPDNRLDTIPFIDIVKIIEELIGKIQPNIIFTHHPGDLNIDHRIVNRAVLTATRPMKGNSVSDIFAFEIPSSTEWAFQTIEPCFRPNVFYSISQSLDIKLQALELYKNEIRAFPHPRSLETIRAIAIKWGATIGVDYAEAFELIRSIR